ncbi:MAG: Txe/YoeB family addiction module toxin [Lewinellaceae bacterium]|nr:Txe/YoeB family addiction module toxin [Lewinellaceae bacterium]
MESDREIARKINQLLKDISRDPFRGLGKPEPLKHKIQGWWSRRITSEHRLIYKIVNDEIWVDSLKGHYD